MNSFTRVALFSFVSFGLGIAVGSLTHSRSKVAEVQTVLVDSSKKRSSDVPAVAPSVDHASLLPSGTAAVERLKVLSWFKDNGLGYLNIPVFAPASDGIDPSFIRFFDLSPLDVETLKVATRRARDQMFDMEKRPQMPR